MSGDTTIQALERLTHMPDSTNPAELIAAQRYYDVEFTGGNISGVTLDPIFSSPIPGQYGGTGIANTGKTLTLGGNLITSGAFSTTVTVTGDTNVTLPTTGTLATLSGVENLSNKTINSSNIGLTIPGDSAFNSALVGVRNGIAGSTIPSDFVVGPSSYSSTSANSYTASTINGANINGTGSVTNPNTIVINSATASGASAGAVTTCTNLRLNDAALNAFSSGFSTAINLDLNMATLSSASNMTNNFGIDLAFPVVGAGSSISGSAYGIMMRAPSISGTGSITSCYGIYIPNLGNANNTNAYGIYVDTQSNSASVNRGIFVNTFTGNNNPFYYASGQFYVDSAGYVKDGGRSRVSTQFDKTNNTFADVTGLTATVLAGGIYSFRAHLTVTSGAGGGIKVAIGGTATATNISYTGYNYNGTTINAITTATSLASAVGAATAISTNVVIEGTIAVANAGTLTVQMAQNVTNGTTTSVLVNSNFTVQRIS